MNAEDGLPIDLGELLLRRVEYGDAADVLEIYGDPDVCRYLLCEPSTPEEVEQYVYYQSDVFAGDPGVPFVLAAVLRSENKVIGDCQLTINDVYAHQGELGFVFHPDYTGRGLATRMVNAALGFGFHQLSLHRIVAGTDVRNERSWRLMERIGMRREAHFRHAHLFHDEWIDDYHYAMLDDEWNARNE